MADSTQTAEPGHPGGGVHPVPLKLLAGVLVGLLLLTALTVAVAGLNLGAASLWIALAIATAKAFLVALYFMHLRWDRPFNGVLFLVALIFILLFVGIALMDTVSYQSTLIPGYAPGLEH